MRSTYRLDANTTQLLGIVGINKATEVPAGGRGVGQLIRDLISQQIKAIAPGQFLKLDVDSPRRAQAVRMALKKTGHKVFVRKDAVYIQA